MPVELLELVADRFKVLSEATRLQILQELQAGELSVTEIVSAIQAGQPNVSKHLRVLQEAGLVQRRQEGNSVYYRIADESIFTMCDAVCGSLKEQAEGAIASLRAF